MQSNKVLRREPLRFLGCTRNDRKNVVRNDKEERCLE